MAEVYAAYEKWCHLEGRIAKSEIFFEKGMEQLFPDKFACLGSHDDPLNDICGWGHTEGYLYGIRLIEGGYDENDPIFDNFWEKNCKMESNGSRAI